MRSEIAYHFLREDMRSERGDEPPWREGEDRSIPDHQDIVLGWRGYHASPTPWDALSYAPGPVICLVELSGEIHRDADDDDELVGRTRRLIRAVNVDRELREFAADCAERMLHIYEREHPGDTRVRDCLATVRRYARGEATDQELTAARSAAADASGAARRAAREAAVAAYYAAWGGGGVGACVAARATADTALAWLVRWEARERFADERAWQLDTLNERMRAILGVTA